MAGYGVLPKERLSVTTAAAVGFAALLGAARVAVVTVDTDKIRYWVDGSTPTSTQGHEVAAGGSFELVGRDTLRNFRAIGSGAATAILEISYFRDLVAT